MQSEAKHMEGNGEISDSDSGIILHSGSDSPTTHTKDVTTHTRAMKLKHQDLREKLERCILELKTLCIREAELTGQLSDDYPLLPGEKPPQIHRRIGAAFKLDDQSIPQGAEDSKLSLVDAELALQMKIFEAARKLYEEQHPSKAVRKSRLLQCKREEKKLKRLQETAFQLQLEHGRSSPLPALNVAQDLGTSDDSSLSDSVVQDEEVISQSSQLSLGISGGTHGNSSTPQSLTDGLCVSPARDTRPQPHSAAIHSPSPSVGSTLSSASSPVCDRPPIEPSPWSESSLDQPYQKSKKTRSSSKTSSPATEVLPPLEACLEKSGLPAQLSHLKLSRSQSSSTPSTPEMRVHRQLSLRLSNSESPFERERGRARGARRRLTEYTITLPETLPAAPPPGLHYASRAGSEDSNSEHSFTSYNSSPCRELLCDSPVQHQSSPRGSYAAQPSPRQPNGFYHNSQHQSSPCFHKAYSPEEVVPYPCDVDQTRGCYPQRSPCPPSRYGYWHQDAAVAHHHQRALRPFPPNPPRLSPSPRPDWERQNYQSGGLSPQLVSEQLKSWHRRSQLRTPRSRSLDRQGAVRLKHLPTQQLGGYPSHKYAEQVIQRRTPQRAADDAQGHWLVDDGTHFASQL